MYVHITMLYALGFVDWEFHAISRIRSHTEVSIAKRVVGHVYNLKLWLKLKEKEPL